jgi:hypothetical protein
MRGHLDELQTAAKSKEAGNEMPRIGPEGEGSQWMDSVLGENHVEDDQAVQQLKVRDDAPYSQNTVQSAPYGQKIWASLRAEIWAVPVACRSDMVRRRLSRQDMLDMRTSSLDSSVEVVELPPVQVVAPTAPER